MNTKSTGGKRSAEHVVKDTRYRSRKQLRSRCGSI
jgi:hypothetical protein